MDSASYYGSVEPSVEPAEFQSSVHDDAVPDSTRPTMGSRHIGCFHPVRRVENHANLADSHTRCVRQTIGDLSEDEHLYYTSPFPPS